MKKPPLHDREQRAYDEKLLRADEKVAKTFPADAYHNEEGFYTMPDPASNDSEFIHDTERGFYVPLPAVKNIRKICFDVPGMVAMAEETIDEIWALVGDMLDTPDWKSITLTEPTYGMKYRVTRLGAEHIMFISEDMLDMKHAEFQMKQAFEAARLERMQTGRGSRPLRA